LVALVDLSQTKGSVMKRLRRRFWKIVRGG
jgi:hypothetical protein